jgi:hypothetical protein
MPAASSGTKRSANEPLDQVAVLAGHSGLALCWDIYQMVTQFFHGMSSGEIWRGGNMRRLLVSLIAVVAIFSTSSLYSETGNKHTTKKNRLNTVF